MAGKENQLSRYGAISKFLPPALGPMAQVFLVAPSADSWYGDAADEFPADRYGTPRVFTTLNAATGQCVAKRGDVVLVSPDYTENIASSTTFAANVAGVSYIGIGEGTLKPTLSFITATTAKIAVTGANVKFENFRFNCNLASVAVALDFSTVAGGVVRNCEFVAAAATKVFLISIQTDASSDDMIIEGNRFQYDNATSNLPTEAIRLVGTDRVKVVRNYFLGNFSTAVINSITTAALDGIIADNFILNKSTSGVGIAMVASSTGIIQNNICYTALAAGKSLASFIAGASCLVADNQIKNVLNSPVGRPNEQIAVSRATATLPATARQSIFTVVGHVKVIELVGTVTTVIQAQITNFKFSTTPTGLASVDVCANVDINAAAVGSMISITGTFATAGVLTAAQTHVAQASPFVTGSGVIEVVTGATSTGSVKYSLIYVPLEEGAYVVAA